MKRAANIIVGAGPAGLATAACLRRRGVEFEILEANDSVGSSWRTHYERLHLHTARDYSALPFMDFDEECPTYPSRQQVVDYLTAYAEEFGIEPRFGQRVTTARRDEDAWVVQTEADDEWHTDRLIVATGYNGRPHIPEFEGVGAFEGPIVHSKEYFDGEAFAGQDVLVVGCGNSGAEIAIDLFEHGARPLICIRGPVHVAPREVMGVPAQVFSLRLSKLPYVVADEIGLIVSKLRYPDLESLGITRPSKGPISMLAEDGRVPMIDIGTIDLIRQGAIGVVPGIARFDDSGVTFVDGRREEVQAVVLATGFESALSDWLYAPEALDARDLPRKFAEEAAPGLHFIGFRNPPIGQLHDIGLEARRLAETLTSEKNARN